MMSSGSYAAFMEARNIEDVWDGYDPCGFDDPDAPLPASDAYGDFGSDWIDCGECIPLPLGEDEIHAHQNVFWRTGLGRGIAWEAAHIGTVELRMAGCLDSGLI